MSDKPAVHAEGLWKIMKPDASHSLEILKDVNLTIKRGEFVAITGPSGAGKSTLLNLIGGLDKPSKGKVKANGRVGFVFQFYHLLADLTALENVMLAATLSHRFFRFFGLPNQKRAAQDILTRLGLAERMKHYPSQLSGGELQRTAIARAIVTNPEILLCDEPTGNLDSANGQQVLDILKGYCESSKNTVILVTHDDKIARISDRVIAMRDGRLE